MTPPFAYLARVTPSISFRPRVRTLAGPPLEIAEALVRLRDFRQRVALSSQGDGAGRWSLIAFDPLEASSSLRELRDVRTALRAVDCAALERVPGPFAGGFLGALSYDAGVAGEVPVWAPTDPWNLPKLVGGLYVDFLVFDLEREECSLVLAEDPGDGRASLGVREQRVLAALAKPAPPHEEHHAELVRHTDPLEHQRRVEAAREAIASGAYYQANLAHRFTTETRSAPDSVFRALHSVNPAPYMAFVEWDDGAIASASPELLLEYEDGRARTRPIKGTARRSSDAFEDAQIARHLLASSKDRAELAMIVDLERNDLGRVARDGTVRIGEFPRLESFASVHHLVCDIQCEVREELDAIDVLEAIFPGGSVTGAPKLAAMHAIRDLEGEGRGFFTGSAGFIDFTGRARFNILIRTIVFREGEASFHVGGGITWSSNAADEERETLVKAERLALALGAPLNREVYA